MSLRKISREQSAGCRCYACDRKLTQAFEAMTSDKQLIWVGSDCASKIVSAKASGWQPPKGGPKLFVPN